MNGPLWDSHAWFPTGEEMDAVAPRRKRLEATRRHILARRRAEGHGHPDRYWWHEAIARELQTYGPLPVNGFSDMLACDAERWCRQMVSWGEAEWVEAAEDRGWVHLRGVPRNHEMAVA